MQTVSRKHPTKTVGSVAYRNFNIYIYICLYFLFTLLLANARLYAHDFDRVDVGF